MTHSVPDTFVSAVPFCPPRAIRIQLNPQDRFRQLFCLSIVSILGTHVPTMSSIPLILQLAPRNGATVVCIDTMPVARRDSLESSDHSSGNMRLLELQYVMTTALPTSVPHQSYAQGCCRTARDHNVSKYSRRKICLVTSFRDASPLANIRSRDLRPDHHKHRVIRRLDGSLRIRWSIWACLPDFLQSHDRCQDSPQFSKSAVFGWPLKN